MKKIITTLALGTVALSACGLTEVSADELRDSLTDDGISQSVADCTVEDLEAELTDDEFQEVAQADEFSELDPDLAERATAIIEACVLAG